MMTDAMVEFEIDVKKMPLGKLTKRHIKRGYEVLTELQGALVGQEPFGGGRASGTNDKAGGIQNMLRWVSPRSIKETFEPPTDFTYPYMDPDA